MMNEKKILSGHCLLSSWPFFLFIFLNLVLIWCTNYFPFQDLPQHLAIVSIWKNLQSHQNHIYHAWYMLPEGFHSYYSIYYLLLSLVSLFSIHVALKILLSVYVVAVFMSFHHLMKTVHGKDSPAWLAILAQLIVWNGALCMGFLSFAFCLPFFLLAVSVYLRLSEAGNKKEMIVLGLSVLGMSLLHVMSGFLLLLFVFIHSVCVRQKRVFVLSFFVILFVVSLSLLWGGIFGGHLGALSGLDLVQAQKGRFGFEFINSLFDLKWSDPPVVLNYFLWNLVGPYRLLPLLFHSGLFLVLGFWFFKTKTLIKPHKPLLSIWLLLLICCVMPWGLYKPTEVTFINFRFIAFSLALCLALLPWSRVNTPLKKYALLICCLLVFSQFAGRVCLFNQELKPALALIHSVPKHKVMLSLMHHNESDYFAKMFRATHFTPLYYTIDNEGVNTQFWARYTKHLPIAYQRGKASLGPPDWFPWEFDGEKHLRGIDYLLVQNKKENELTDNQTVLIKDMEKMRCQQNWCLYKK
ncbi:hypothetical protein KJ708_09835 [bacterium]|nr:hypothetical protein [bacterium]